MTDIARDLIQRLADALTNAIRVVHNEDGTQHVSTATPVLTEARAFLDQPEPEGPTAWMYLGEPDYDGRDWHDHWEVTLDEKLARYKSGNKDPVPLWRTTAIQPEPEGLTDEELLELMPETMRDEFSCIAKLYSDATGGQVEPGIFRVALNTAALEYAQAVLARSGQTSEFRRFQQTHCYD